MNEDDSQRLAQLYALKGYEISDNREDSDLVIINSCTVRQHAEDKAVSELGRLRKWKKAKQGRKIIFAGCAAQRLKKDLKKRFPFLDSVIGAKDYKDLFSRQDSKILSQYPQAKIFNSPISDYLTIMRGCSMKCSYCIVPAVRGPAVSSDFEEILNSAKNKVSTGIKELILLGQTVNCYKDREKNKTFTDLLKALSEIDGLERIKFMSPHPLFFTKDFFDLFSKEKKISRHIHLPVQSGCDKVLSAMKRGYKCADYLQIIEKLRKADDSVSISTDFIVGFPGETQKDFEETLKLAEKAKFSFAFCFKYSPRTDKPSDISDISDLQMSKRLSILLEKVKEISKKVFEGRIGKTEEVLAEKENYGKTSSGFNCAIIDSRKVKAGEKVQVKIEKTAGNKLYGKVLK